MQIDSKSNTPVFQQIVAGLLSSIAAGIYREGEGLPSTRSMALKLQVNPNTVQRAYEELVSIGVIESKRGLGKFVSKTGANSAIEQSKSAVRQLFDQGIIKAKSANLPEKVMHRLFEQTMNRHFSEHQKEEAKP